MSIQQYTAGLIQNNEIKHAIDVPANRKSVGSDGLTDEIIKQNKDDLIH